jgi:hypothetical protein
LRLSCGMETTDLTTYVDLGGRKYLPDPKTLALFNTARSFDKLLHGNTTPGLSIKLHMMEIVPKDFSSSD